MREDPKASKNLRAALLRLQSLRDGFAGAADVVAFGALAVPALAEILAAPEPSGIYQPRLRVFAER